MEALRRLRPADLASVMRVYRDLLRSHQESINRLNVYPVPDGDTGTNMALTLESVVSELDAAERYRRQTASRRCARRSPTGRSWARGELRGDPVAAAARHLGRARPRTDGGQGGRRRCLGATALVAASDAAQRRRCCGRSRGRSSRSPARPGKGHEDAAESGADLVEVAEQARERGAARSGSHPRAAPGARPGRGRRRRGSRLPAAPRRLLERGRRACAARSAARHR